MATDAVPSMGEGAEASAGGRGIRNYAIFVVLAMGGHEHL